ncbi:protealysin inhibitor emfourin [Microbacterium aurum]|uniref:protealysin inhibitor emfourin n=1 Tax=Microbacterium aurum TaxID=36805 RepID=UPI001E505378|nr:protealysin inhibitor emfourin [Microbacterium aurum]MBM7828915.1 hypothetical protein [Microbacterium aurum]MCG7415576.1 hypothetical protein [Microbacterium aurum]
MTNDPEPAGGEPDAVVAVTVSRSGGIAGMTRRWAVQSQSAEDAAQWRALVEACPWDECDSARPTGADRFAWSVRATLPDASRHADLTEDQASGPWRTLIDAVREAAAG